MRIILVDDEAYVTSTLAAKFRKAGHEVRVATNGIDAFALVVQDVPDLIITDYQMPGLRGYEMSVNLKSDARTTRLPVLMLTGRGHLLSVKQLELTNIKAVLAKPFSTLELLSKVKEICSL